MPITRDFRGREIIIRLSEDDEARAAGQDKRSGMLPPTKTKKALTRRRFTSGIKFYDLAYFRTGGTTFDTVPLSVGDPLTRPPAFANWDDLADGFNFPLSIDPADWKSTFAILTNEYQIQADIMDAAFNVITEQVDLSGGGGYKLPADMAPGDPINISFTNATVGDTRAFFEGGLFSQFNIAGFDLFGFYWTNTPDPGAPTVTPTIDVTQAMDVFLPPAAIRVTGEYFPDAAPGSGGSGGGVSPYRPMPHPMFTGNFFLLDPLDCPGTGQVYYRLVPFPPGVQFSLLPGGGVQPPFIVCGLTGSGSDGEYDNFSPDKDELNSPTIFFDRENVFANYLEGDRTADDVALRERMVSIARLQGAQNVIRRGGVWSIGAARDDMTNSRLTAGGQNGTEPQLSGAIFQGGTRWFRWRNL